MLTRILATCSLLFLVSHAHAEGADGCSAGTERAAIVPGSRGICMEISTLDATLNAICATPTGGVSKKLCDAYADSARKALREQGVSDCPYMSVWVDDSRQSLMWRVACLLDADGTKTGIKKIEYAVRWGMFDHGTKMKVIGFGLIPSDAAFAQWLAAARAAD
jgi:hypothetical protein